MKIIKISNYEEDENETRNEAKQRNCYNNDEWLIDGPGLGWVGFVGADCALCTVHCSVLCVVVTSSGVWLLGYAIPRSDQIYKKKIN